MKATIHNFGRVTTADVKLDGVTVIAGSNGSGKSTISRVLMTWISCLRQIDNRIAEERVKSIIEDISGILTAAELPILFVPSSSVSRQLRKLLSYDFWRNREEAVRWIVGHLRGMGGWRMRDDGDTRLYNAVDNLYESIFMAVDKCFNTADEPYEAFVVNSFFRRAFDGQVGTFFDMAAESFVAVEMDGGVEKEATFKAGKCSSMGNVRGNHVIPTFYIEPRHLIDSYVESNFSPHRLNRFPESRFSCGEELEWKRILYTNPEMDLWSMQRAQRQEALNEELDKIVATMHGQIEKDEREIRFRDSDNGGMISIRNVASGVKSMAALIRGLRNGVIEPGNLLIIDEPEANLHPEWQIKFAEFLVLLNAKFGIRSLLNTHSPYFLKAIQVYSDLLDVAERCNYYMMESDGNGGRYHTNEVTNDIEQVFAAMSAPYAKLIYGERYDSQMEQSK